MLARSYTEPPKANQDPDARRVSFDREAYRDRNIVERLIGWLKESRRVLTRFEKTATNYLACSNGHASDATCD